ncbi:YczE/YyaS/YitT family protein [Pelosinus propionicus]|uniref:Uncharacterized membrane protein YczE n=1 Tax=Pelosinus propionicus DSM 13327 TaxID=1123291 RepID=A0A1I4M7N0_9FIRM|nr:membrane protein [Pelosinus propionicus]SFL99170.1 Uncharacterized membrane protein YczE [Pelosinus propionicus DSM 13327]
MIKRFIFLLWGLFLFAFGIVMTIKSNLGTSPWDALHIGLIRYLPLTLGQVSQLTGVIVIVISYFLGMKPGWGTIANMYFIGLFMDVIIDNKWIPDPIHWVFQGGFLLAGILIIGWGSFFYLSAALGAGPRDSFMVGAVTKTGYPVWKVRTVIESSIAILGYFLGGPIGIGTIIIALTLGPSVQWAFSLMGKKAQEIEHDSLTIRLEQ